MYSIEIYTAFPQNIRGVSESQEDEFEEIWRERTAETEDEVIALAVSFSIVQMLLAQAAQIGQGVAEHPGSTIYVTASCIDTKNE